MKMMSTICRQVYFSLGRGLDDAADVGAHLPRVARQAGTGHGEAQLHQHVAAEAHGQHEVDAIGRESHLIPAKEAVKAQAQERPAL